MDAMDENSAIRQSGLPPGQMIAFATDGIWEARNTRGEMLGQRRLKTLLPQDAGADAAALVDRLFESLQDFTRVTLPEAGQTLVMAQIQESDTP